MVDYDARDPYSSSSDDDDEEKLTSTGNSPRKEVEENKASLQLTYRPFQTISRSNMINIQAIRSSKQTTKGSKLNKIQQLFIKIQYKLFAVIAFRQIYRGAGLQLTHLNLSDCKLTSISSLLLRMALLDKSCITDIDLSNNPMLFASSIDDIHSNEQSLHEMNVKSSSYQALGDITMQFYYMLMYSKLR
jgi:hypothetical protein